MTARGEGEEGVRDDGRRREEEDEEDEEEGESDKLL